MLREWRGDIQIEYLYDPEGITGLKYNNKAYYFVKSLQGDVDRIYNENRYMVAEYIYDAWGAHSVVCYDENGALLSSPPSDHVGLVNPFRYRGYFWDSETGLFLVTSRYYDPETGRFISPDDISYLDPETTDGLNLYAYCWNNPLMYINSGISLGSGGTVASSILGGDGGGIGSQSLRSAPEWLKIGVGAIPDIILGLKYLRAKGIHNKFVYSTNTLYMFPELGANWSRFKIAKHGYGDLVGASFKQIITGNARADWGAVAKSFGKTVALTGLINFGFNLYENNWQIDGAMLLDTAIDTAIGLGAYGLAAGTTSLVVGGLAMAGVAIPGIVVVGGIILLSIGFDWLIREITGYKN